jgi:hypothetical protein
MKPTYLYLKHAYLVWLIVLLVAIWVNACTNNPFASAPTVSSQNQIYGKIRFLQSDSLPLPRALVWLEALDIGTYSDAQGNFRMVLPSPSVQPVGGITGSSNVYFYVANYTVDSIRVVLHNGEFVYDRGVVDENGRITKIVTLQQLLQLSVEVAPAIITSEYEGELSVYATLTPIDTALQINVMGKSRDDIGCIGLQLTGVADSYSQVLKLPQATLQTRILREQTVWKFQTVISPYEIRLGKYRVVPFLWIKNNLPPLPLLAYLGTQPDSFEKSFFNIPFYRNEMFLNVVEPK